MSALLPRLARALARVSSRWIPDSFSIAALLTALTFLLGLTLGGASPTQCLEAWGRGFWELLTFAMQIVMVIFAGYVMAVSPPVTRILEALAGLPRSPRQVVAWTALLSMALCWLNWGMGLIAAAVLVRIMARRHPDVDYRLLAAVAYLGMGTTWHAGPSGSAPLLMATPGSFLIKDGMIDAPVPLAETVFTPVNALLMAAVALGFALFAGLLHPRAGDTRPADRAALDALSPFRPPERPEAPTPAERLMYSPILNRFLGGLGLLYVALQAHLGAFSLTLDSVNLVFLSLAVALHPHPASLLRASEQASTSLHGVVLQFPLYAGIYGIIKGTGLAGDLARAFLSVATVRTFPLLVFWYSAVLNYFVPSGGGKWAVEAVYVLGAARELGIPASGVVMAYAYGDMATNLIQPFWAIPLLGVARLEFREILGYEILLFLLFSALISGVLLLG
jgi:short-chain fatty acids transporter